MLQNAGAVTEISQYIPDGHVPVCVDGDVLLKQYAKVVSFKQANRLSLLQVRHIVGVAVQSATISLESPQIGAISAHTVPTGHILVIASGSVVRVPVASELRIIFVSSLHKII